MYGRFLEDKIGYLRGCTASLREQAEMCDKNTTLQSFDSIQEMLRQLATVQSNVSDIKNDVGKVLDKQSSQEEATNALSKTLLQSQAGILDWMKRLDMLQARLLFRRCPTEPSSEPSSTFRPSAHELMQCRIRDAEFTGDRTSTNTDVRFAPSRGTASIGHRRPRSSSRYGTLYQAGSHARYRP